MKLLQIDSSILGDASASRELGAAWVRDWQRRHPGAEVRYRDLARDPLAHLSGEIFSARANPDAARGTAFEDHVAADQAALNEFLAADVVVIGAPMYNFSLPTQLKAWIDRIVVAGKTFRYTANGPEGLVPGKKVVVISSRGGVYSQGPAAALDHQEAYLRGVLGFIGVTDIEFVRAEGLAHGPEQRAEAMRAAHRGIGVPVAIAA